MMQRNVVITNRFHVALRLFCQPRSQTLSPLPPFVVGRKTLVATGHVTNQNLGGKKIYWAVGVAEYFDCCCGKLSGFQNLEQSLMTTRSFGVQLSNSNKLGSPMEN